MKPILALLAAAAISTAIGATAYAATPRNRAGTPPSATELGLDNSHAAAWEQLRAETIALREAGRDFEPAGFGGGSQVPSSASASGQ